MFGLLSRICDHLDPNPQRCKKKDIVKKRSLFSAKTFANRSAMMSHGHIFSLDGPTACTDLLEPVLVRIDPLKSLPRNLRIQQIP